MYIYARAENMRVSLASPYRKSSAFTSRLLLFLFVRAVRLCFAAPSAVTLSVDLKSTLSMRRGGW